MTIIRNICILIPESQLIVSSAHMSANFGEPGTTQLAGTMAAQVHWGEDRRISKLAFSEYLRRALSKLKPVLANSLFSITYECK